MRYYKKWKNKKVNKQKQKQKTMKPKKNKPNNNNINLQVLEVLKNWMVENYISHPHLKP